MKTWTRIATALCLLGVASGGCELVGNPLQEYTVVERGQPIADQDTLPPGTGGPLLAKGQYRGWVPYKTVANTCPVGYSGPSSGQMLVDITDSDGLIRMRAKGDNGAYPEQTGTATASGATLQGMQLFAYKGETVECRGKSSATPTPTATKVRVTEDMTSPTQLNCSNTVEFSLPPPQ